MEGYAHVTARHHYARKHRGASAPPTLHLHPYGMTSKLCRGYNFGSGEMIYTMWLSLLESWKRV